MQCEIHFVIYYEICFSIVGSELEAGVAVVKIHFLFSLCLPLIGLEMDFFMLQSRSHSLQKYNLEIKGLTKIIIGLELSKHEHTDFAEKIKPGQTAGRFYFL